MKNDLIAQLQADFVKWRRRKRFPTEPVPGDLIVRARRAAKIHGFGRVKLATGISRERIEKKAGASNSGKRSMPSFSKFEMSVPQLQQSPLVEAETVTGVRLRVFAITTETANLLSSLCRGGHQS